MIKIPLSNSEKVALIDDDDYAHVSRYTWRLSVSGYAQRGQGHFMHRDILQPGSLQTHHIDGNKLNNQRKNLRIVTQAQNGQARKLQTNNCSGFRGVTYQHPSWKAQIYVNRKRICLGCYSTPEAAALAYDQAAIKFFGTNATLNNP